LITGDQSLKNYLFNLLNSKFSEMKNLILVLFLLVTLLYTACTGTTSTSNSNSGTSAGSAIALPYTAGYSSSFSIGSDSSVATVLSSYKAWENGDMDGLKNTLADSVALNFSDGFKFLGTRDSATKMAKLYRDSLSKVQLKIDAWVPLHSKDKNADWVSVWYTEIDTYKNGKVDSAYFQDDNMLDKSGKITFTGSHKQILK
jgi:hypothetical protein